MLRERERDRERDHKRDIKIKIFLISIYNSKVFFLKAASAFKMREEDRERKIEEGSPPVLEKRCLLTIDDFICMLY